MKSCLLAVCAIPIFLAAVRAESPATNTPPGAMQMQDNTNAEPQTPAPPQAKTKSAPGANAQNGANGTTLSGKPVTKGPNTPEKKAPPSPEAAPAPANGGNGASTQKMNPPTPPANQKSATVLDHYLQDLNAVLKLNDDEKKAIQTYYLEDGATVQGILGNVSVSPLQQAQQVSVLRDKRNEKIEALLANADRQRDFFRVESTYRVALTEAAGDGKLTPAQPAAPAPAPADIDPAKATPIPTKFGPTEGMK